MIYEDLPHGRARIVKYLPTIPAMRYLNCCTMAGWHKCNSLYRQIYPNGVTELLILYTVDGAGVLEMNEKSYTLSRDSLAFVPPETPMSYFTDQQKGEWEFFWLDLTGERALSLSNKLWQDGHRIFRGVQALEPLFSELLRDASSETDRSSLIGKLFDRIISAEIFEDEQNGSAVNKILSYISEHYMERIDLQHMSDRFYLSQNQIIRIVRERTGYTPHEYLIRFRLAKACELLQCTSTPVCEIGRAVGYGNNSHFSAAFRQLYGISPAEYRSRFSR